MVAGFDKYFQIAPCLEMRMLEQIESERILSIRFKCLCNTEDIFNVMKNFTKLFIKFVNKKTLMKNFQNKFEDSMLN